MGQDRMINVLLEIKADVSDLKRGQLELKEGQNRIEIRLYKIEDDFTDMKNDIIEIKTTVAALSDALLDTSKEVKQLKGKSN